MLMSLCMYVHGYKVETFSVLRIVLGRTVIWNDKVRLISVWKD